MALNKTFHKAKVSNFFHYFSYNFRQLGLKELIATSYKSCDADLFSPHESAQAICLRYGGTSNENNIPSDDEIIQYSLMGDGDFRSDECIAHLHAADIVVTNPPFSLFREYVAQLIHYDKKFLILGQQNAITYKEIFSLIKNKEIWLGVNNGGAKWFQVNPDYRIKTPGRQKTENGYKFISMGYVVWFTNLDHFKRHEELKPYRAYNPEDYPQYDNYDAIEVSRYLDIPADYDGVMGVPITFLDKHNPDQFEIIGMDRPLVFEMTGRVSRFRLKVREVYARIVIRKKGG